MVILNRLLLTIGIIGLGMLSYWMLNALMLQRVRYKTAGLESRRPGIPAILYFTTPSCVPCITVQRPELARLQRKLGDRIQVIEVNCAEKPELADYWGVLSVPTTFILDGQGRPRGVNHGVTRAERLRQQIQTLQMESNGARSQANET